MHNHLGKYAMLRRRVPVIAAALCALSVPCMPAQARADEVGEAQDAVDDAKAHVSDAEASRRQVLGRVEQTQAAIDRLERSEIPDARKRLSEAVASDYKMRQANGAMRAVSMLLGCSSLEEVESVMHAQESIVNSADDAYDDLLAKQDEAAKAKRALDIELERADAALSEANVSLADRQRDLRDARDRAEREEREREERERARSESAQAQGGAEAPSPSDTWNSGYMSVSQMKFQGVVYDNGYRYTYYEESVLPGGGLDIPGRHHYDGKVVDGDGYICVASNDLPRGTVVPTPLGDGKVYDCGCASGTLDLYLV